MTRREIDYRRKVASFAKKVREGSIIFFDFLEGIGGEYKTGDDEVDELIDLFEHEPAKGGILGVSEEEYAGYMNEVDRLINELCKE